jgi:hypothetical protein
MLFLFIYKLFKKAEWYIALNERTTASNEFKGMWKETVVAQIMVSFLHFGRAVEENYYKFQSE